MKSLWTVWTDYDATGEGHTSMVWIGYALDEVEAREFFEQRFGDFFVKFCTSGQGVVINDVTEILVPAGTAKRLERAAGRANVDFYSQFHLNAS